MKLHGGTFYGYFAQMFCVMALAMAAGLSAQVDQGAVSGVVLDQTGSAIARAEVTLANEQTGLTFSRSSNTSGFFNFTPIKIGVWSFYIFSSGSRLNQLWRGEFEGEAIEQCGLLGDFLA